MKQILETIQELKDRRLQLYNEPLFGLACSPATYLKLQSFFLERSEMIQLETDLSDNTLILGLRIIQLKSLDVDCFIEIDTERKALVLINTDKEYQDYTPKMKSKISFFKLSSMYSSVIT